MGDHLLICLHSSKGQSVNMLHHQRRYVFGAREFCSPIYKMVDLNVIVPVILFVLLTPGVLLALPPGQSLIVQSVTHAAVFGAVYAGLRSVFPQYY